MCFALTYYVKFHKIEQLTTTVEVERPILDLEATRLGYNAAKYNTIVQSCRYWSDVYLRSILANSFISSVGKGKKALFREYLGIALAISVQATGRPRDIISRGRADIMLCHTYDGPAVSVSPSEKVISVNRGSRVHIYRTSIAA